MIHSRKIKIIISVIMGLAVCCGGIYVLLTRFYFYNKYNIHARRAALERLNYRYNQEFELLSTEFETKETKEGGAAYVHIWTYEFQDNEGRRFFVYVWGYGLVEKGDGDFYASDYGTYIDDTYRQE